MADDLAEPQSLLAVTNYWSKALLPSEVYDDRFVQWAHDHGAYLYLVLVGPKTEIMDLVQESDGWKMKTRFHDGSQFKPRTIPVPFDLLPRKGTRLVDGAVNWVDEQGENQRSNAVDLTRRVLARAWRPGQHMSHWHEWTLRKFFTYRVEYIGQSFGKQGERTAAERIGEGHETVQRVLAQVGDLYPNSAVALIVLDAAVQGRELSGSIGPDNGEEIARMAMQAMTEPEGPLVDQAKLVTVAEAMLIRSFPETRNKQYESFPSKDAPALVAELRAAGVTHLGVQLDVSRSLALLNHPDRTRAPQERLRFAVNLATGARETLDTTAPLSWQAD